MPTSALFEIGNVSGVIALTSFVLLLASFAENTEENETTGSICMLLFIITLPIMGIGWGVGRWQEKRVFGPWRTELVAVADRAELMACDSAGLEEPHWSCDRTRRPQFQCTDRRGVLHDLIPPACNRYEYRMHVAESVDEAEVRRFAADCNTTLAH